MTGPVKVKVVVLIVEGFIASLKVAATTELGQMPVEPFGGVTETDRGQVQSVAQSRPNGRAVFCEVHPRGPKFNRGQTTMIVRRSSSVPQVP